MPILTNMLRRFPRNVAAGPSTAQGALFVPEPGLYGGHNGQYSMFPPVSYEEELALRQISPAYGRVPDEATRPFYLRTERLFADPNSPLQPAASGQQYLSQLQKMPGIKQEELQATGLAEWLPQQGKVTREEVADFIQAYPGRPEMTRLTLGDPLTEPGALDQPRIPRSQEMQEYGDMMALLARGQPRQSATPTLQDQEARVAYILEDLERTAEARGAATNRQPTLIRDDLQQFALQESRRLYDEAQQYLGADDVRARLLQEEAQAWRTASDRFPSSLPSREQGALAMKPKYEAYTEVGGGYYTEDLMQMPNLNRPYEHPHWTDVPDSGNYVSHTRQKVRFTPEGQQVTFVEESQSDLAQAGAKVFQRQVEQEFGRTGRNKIVGPNENAQSLQLKYMDAQNAGDLDEAGKIRQKMDELADFEAGRYNSPLLKPYRDLTAQDLKAKGISGFGAQINPADLDIADPGNWEMRPLTETDAQNLPAQLSGSTWGAFYRPTGEMAFAGESEQALWSRRSDLLNNPQASRTMMDQVRGTLGADAGGLPETPFKGDEWRTLNFKNQLARAVEDDSEYVALTPAWMQNRRYHGNREAPTGGGGWDNASIYYDAGMDRDGDYFVRIYDGDDGTEIDTHYFTSPEQAGERFPETDFNYALENIQSAYNDAPIYVSERERTIFRIIDEDGNEVGVYDFDNEYDNIPGEREDLLARIADESPVDEDGEPLWSLDEDTEPQYEVYNEDVGDSEYFDDLYDAEEHANTLRREWAADNIDTESGSIERGQVGEADEYVRNYYGGAGETRDPGEFYVPYEKALPNKINKYLKQLSKETGEQYQLERIDVQMDVDATGEPGPEEVWGLKLTPTLKQHIKGDPRNPFTGGQSMFAAAAPVGAGMGAMQPQQPQEPQGALQTASGTRGILDEATTAVSGYMDEFAGRRLPPPGNRSLAEGMHGDTVAIAAGLENLLALATGGVMGVMGALNILGNVMVGREQDTDALMNEWQEYAYAPRSTQSRTQQEFLLDQIRANPRLRDALQYLGELPPAVEESILGTTGSVPLSQSGRAVMEMM